MLWTLALFVVLTGLAVSAWLFTKYAFSLANKGGTKLFIGIPLIIGAILADTLICYWYVIWFKGTTIFASFVLPMWNWDPWPEYPVVQSGSRFFLIGMCVIVIITIISSITRVSLEQKDKVPAKEEPAEERSWQHSQDEREWRAWPFVIVDNLHVAVIDRGGTFVRVLKPGFYAISRATEVRNHGGTPTERDHDIVIGWKSRTQFAFEHFIFTSLLGALCASLFLLIRDRLDLPLLGYWPVPLSFLLLGVIFIFFETLAEKLFPGFFLAIPYAERAKIIYTGDRKSNWFSEAIQTAIRLATEKGKISSVKTGVGSRIRGKHQFVYRIRQPILYVKLGVQEPQINFSDFEGSDAQYLDAENMSNDPELNNTLLAQVIWQVAEALSQDCFPNMLPEDIQALPAKIWFLGTKSQIRGYVRGLPEEADAEADGYLRGPKLVDYWQNLLEQSPFKDIDLDELGELNEALLALIDKNAFLSNLMQGGALRPLQYRRGKIIYAGPVEKAIEATAAAHQTRQKTLVDASAEADRKIIDLKAVLAEAKNDAAIVTLFSKKLGLDESQRAAFVAFLLELRTKQRIGEAPSNTIFLSGEISKFLQTMGFAAGAGGSIVKGLRP